MCSSIAFKFRCRRSGHHLSNARVLELASVLPVSGIWTNTCAPMHLRPTASLADHNYNTFKSKCSSCLATNSAFQDPASSVLALVRTCFVLLQSVERSGSLLESVRFQPIDFVFGRTRACVSVPIPKCAARGHGTTGRRSPHAAVSETPEDGSRNPASNLSSQLKPQ